VSGTSGGKRKHSEDEAASAVTPASKQARTSAAQVEDEDMKEVVPCWAEDSSAEEDFEECADF
jgi:hypothetical protein